MTLDVPPTLDVIIATNRESPFVEEALASVVAQSGVECNIVLVDDGSPCPDYLRRCTANIARAVVVRQAHAGQSAARNRGLREAGGPYVAFLDDDDVWHPLKARKQIEALDQEREAVACFCWGSYIDSNGVDLGSWSPATPSTSTDFLRAATPLPRIVTLVVRRAICEEVGGFDEGITHFEDHEFIFRVLLRGEFTAVPDKLVYYRQHDANISHNVATETRDAADRMILGLIAMCERRADPRAALFREQLPTIRAEACVASLRAMRHALGHRQWARAGSEGRWLAKHAHWLSTLPEGHRAETAPRAPRR